MTISTFPNIKPNFIKPLNLPEYDISETEWKSGFSTAIRESYQGIETEIILEYQHLSHTETINIINFYSSVRGVSTGFLLPSVFVKFPENAVNVIALLEATTVWKFANEPTFTLLVANPEIGRYNGSIQLKSVSNDITTGNVVATPLDVVYEVIAEPLPIAPPSNDQETEITESEVISSDNPNPVVNTDPEISRLLRTTLPLNIPEIIGVADYLLKTINFSQSLFLLRIDCNRKIRLRIYLNSAYRNDDLSRSITGDLAPDHGLLFEGVFTSSISTINTTPVPILYSLDGEAKTYYLTVNNLDTINISNFDITFTFLTIENV